jgi:hypothetical protein
VLGLLLAWQIVSTMGTDAISRPYHPVTIAAIADSQWSHVEVCGTVTLAKWEDDGDRHIRLSDDSGAFIVAEIVPYHPVTVMP